MEKIVCPECGALNFAGFLTYPICHQCHANLQRCGYCRHFPGSGRPCPRTENETPVNADSVRRCGEFERPPSRLSRSAPRRPLRAVAWASVLVGTLFGLLIVAASVLAPPAEEPQVSVSVDFPRIARVGQPVSGQLTIRNKASRRSERLRLRLAERTLGGFHTPKVSPVEREFVSGNYHYYQLPELPPQETLTVDVVLAPAKEGRRRLSFQLYDHGNQLRSDPLTWRLDVKSAVPITVTPASGS